MYCKFLLIALASTVSACAPALSDDYQDHNNADTISDTPCPTYVRSDANALYTSIAPSDNSTQSYSFDTPEPGHYIFDFYLPFGESDSPTDAAPRAFFREYFSHFPANTTQPLYQLYQLNSACEGSRLDDFADSFGFGLGKDESSDDAMLFRATVYLESPNETTTICMSSRTSDAGTLPADVAKSFVDCENPNDSY